MLETFYQHIWKEVVIYCKLQLHMENEAYLAYLFRYVTYQLSL